MRVSAALGWAVACQLALLCAVFAAVELRPGIAEDIVSLGALSALVFLMATWGVLAVHCPQESLSQALALRPSHAALPWVGLALGVALKLPAEALYAAVERAYPSTEQELLARAHLLSTKTPARLLALTFAACIVGPFVEELFYRGALFGRLARRAPWAGGAITAGAFVLVHGDARAWPTLAVVAAVLTVLRVQSGSLLPCLALHVAFNSVGVFGLATGRVSATRPLDAPVPLLFSSWAACALLMLLAYRLASTPGAERARAEDRR